MSELPGSSESYRTAGLGIWARVDQSDLRPGNWRRCLRQHRCADAARASLALWRLSFPEVVEDNDRLADLHRVANDLAGNSRRSITGYLTSGSTTTTRSSITVRHCSAGCSAWGRTRTSRSPRSFFPRSCSAWPGSSSRLSACACGCEADVDRGARDWRNGDLASSPF